MRLWNLLPLFPAALLVSLALLGFSSTIGPAPGPAAAAGGLLEVEDVLSGLPNNAAQQGVATDGTCFYLIGSHSTKGLGPTNRQNNIRKYCNGGLVLEKLDAYDVNRTFSSGEVLEEPGGGKKLCIAVRDFGTGTTWGHIACFDLVTLDLIEDHELGTATDPPFDDGQGGYAIPEGIDQHDGYLWVMFGGGGGTGNSKTAVGQYDLDFNEIAVYDLFSNNGPGQWGGQDIVWQGNCIYSNNHEGHIDAEFQRWCWNGAGFDLDVVWPQLQDTPTSKMGQGFTFLGGHIYFAARYSDRLVKAELVDAAKPTPTPTVTLTPAPTAKPLPTPKATPTPNPSANGSLEVDTNCAEDGIQSQRNALLGVPFTVCLFAEFPSPNSAAGYQVRLEWDPSILQLDPRTATDNDVWNEISESQCGPPNGASVSQNPGTGFIELSAVDTGNENACRYQGVVAELVFSCQSHAPTNLEMTGPGTNTFFSDAGVAQVKPSLKAAVIICLEPDFDSDLDGCTNAAELDTNEVAGGLRDPHNFWDFVDQWTGVPPEKNGTVTVGDLGAVVARFGTFQDPHLTEEEALAEALTPPVAVNGYHASADRSGSAGPNPWNLLPPNGTITIGDLGVVVAQFGHACA